MGVPDLPDLEAWIGRERVEEDVLSEAQARRLAATLERDPERLRVGGLLPPGWHWVYFGTPAPRSELGPDGHEKLGGFLPPSPYPRRMWAGGTLRFTGSLRLGERATRRSTVEAVTAKEGRTGPLVFVTVRHRIAGAEGVAVDEAQELVYRPAPESGYAALAPREPGATPTAREPGAASASREPGAAPLARQSSAVPPARDPRAVPTRVTPASPPDHAAGSVELPGAAWSERFVADQVTLFRFSALTFNAHRIHYDRPYATETEGYPDLVVHGPLLALLLLEAGVRRMRAATGDDLAAPWTFRYRALRPVFCHEPFRLEGVPGGGTLRAIHDDRGVLMEAEIAAGT